MRDPNLSRRQLLKTLAVGLASTIAGPAGRPWFATIAQAQSGEDTGVLTLKLSSFPILQSVGGSLMLQVPGMPLSFPQVLVTRKTSVQFFAVDSVCTHEGCTVTPYNATLQAIVCFCHFSRFNADGTVINGPAAQPLKAYPTTFNGTDTIRVQIPGLGYRINSELTPIPGGKRLAITVPTVDDWQYEIRFRASLTTTESVKTFATTPQGNATHSVIFGNGLEQTVYVDVPGQTGFFVVACR